MIKYYYGKLDHHPKLSTLGSFIGNPIIRFSFTPICWLKGSGYNRDNVGNQVPKSVYWMAGHFAVMRTLHNNLWSQVPRALCHMCSLRTWHGIKVLWSVWHRVVSQLCLIIHNTNYEWDYATMSQGKLWSDLPPHDGLVLPLSDV